MRFFWKFVLQVQQSSNAAKTTKKKNLKRDAGDDNPEEYADPETPFGDKKRLSKQMAKAYNPTAVENSYVFFVGISTYDIQLCYTH